MVFEGQTVDKSGKILYNIYNIIGQNRRNPMTQSYETKVIHYVGQAAMMIQVGVGVYIIAVFLFFTLGIWRRII